MKIKNHFIIFLLGALGFIAFCLISYYSQQNQFENLKKEGRYSIGVGKSIKERRTGWEFIYLFKVEKQEYSGSVVFGIGDYGMAQDSIYFIIFDPKNPKKNFLIRYPSVPSGINLDSVPTNGWAELPLKIKKDSIRSFLD